jgi:Flp pilus assembly protein CpaB
LEDRSRRRARLFTIVGVVLALVSGGVTYLYANQASQTLPQQEEKAPVVVAARDLAARQAVGASDVTVASYPKSLVPPAALTEPDEVIGKVLTVAVARGEPVLPAKFAQHQGQAAFTVLPAGVELRPDSPSYRAMSINVPDQNAVGGNIVPGDIVDLVATVNVDPMKFFTPAPPAPPDQNRVVDFSSKVILENVSVLAKTNTIYTIRLNDLAMAEKIVYLQTSGATVSMLLRAPKDERVVATGGSGFERVYRDFGFTHTRRFGP